MKQLGLIAGLCCTAFFAAAQTDSDIFLFELSVKKDKVIASKPVNITKHKGYDNQPYFHPDLPLIYYSSVAADGHTDIASYNYKTGETKSITSTPEGEYSPTVTPDGSSLSCIILRDNKVQDLAKYPIEGGEVSVIVNNLTVGYHVWTDNSHVAMFILGTPNTLHYYRLPTKKDTIIASNIGKSLQRVPGETAISFVHKVSDTEWIIKKLDTRTLALTSITRTLPGREEFTWTPDGKIIMSDGTKILFFAPGRSSSWKELDLSSGFEVLKGVTRIAVSADGKKMAVVVSE